MAGRVHRAGESTTGPRTRRGRNGRFEAAPQWNAAGHEVNPVPISVRNRASAPVAERGHSGLSSRVSSGLPFARFTSHIRRSSAHTPMSSSRTAPAKDSGHSPNGRTGSSAGTRAWLAARPVSAGADTCTARAP